MPPFVRARHMPLMAMLLKAKSFLIVVTCDCGGPLLHRPASAQEAGRIIARHPHTMLRCRLRSDCFSAIITLEKEHEIDDKC